MPKSAPPEPDEPDEVTAPNTDVGSAPAQPSEPNPGEGIEELGYEAARDELAAIVARLESGEPSLEDSMRLWERGEALAEHCQRWLSAAERRIDTMTAERDPDE